MDQQTIEAVLGDVASGEPTHRAVESRGYNRRDWYAAMASDESLANRYARAKYLALESMADELLEIVDDQSLSPDSRRVMIDPRKWLLSKLAPKKYGDKLDVAHSGNVTVQSIDYSKCIDVTPYDTDSMSPMRVIDSKDSSES